jgi:hypothetical protein
MKIKIRSRNNGGDSMEAGRAFGFDREKREVHRKAMALMSNSTRVYDHSERTN